MAISDKMQNDIIDFQAGIRALMLKQDPYTLNEVKTSINQLFGGDGCKQVLYTENTDKMFFGVCVMPVIPAANVIDLIQSDEKYIIKDYYLELDSKLFDPAMSLSYMQISAIIMHEVGHLISDSTPLERVKNNIDAYLLERNETIKLTDSVHYIEILSYGIRDALRKVTSIFEADENEIVDQFDIDCGIADILKDAMSKIASNGYNVNAPIDNKIVVLSWVMRLYRDVLHNRIAAVHSLSRGIQMVASKLEAKELHNIIRRLERIDDDVLLSESFIDDILQVFKRNVAKMKVNGIKTYEDDYFEIEFSVNNMETQDDAVLLLHRINSRMAVIDDFLTSEELDKVSYKRWADLYNKYNTLRGNIAKNKIYQNKTRLYVNYGFDN